MNVTEVPTDSGLGVYHIVPWAVVPTQHQPDTGVRFLMTCKNHFNVICKSNIFISTISLTPKYHVGISHISHIREEVTIYNVFNLV